MLGVPVIARRCRGNISLIFHNQNGLLYESPEEFIQQAIRLLDNNPHINEREGEGEGEEEERGAKVGLRERLIANGKRTIATQYDSEQEKTNYRQLVQHLLSL